MIVNSSRLVSAGGGAGDSSYASAFFLYVNRTSSSTNAVLGTRLMYL